MTQDEVKMAPNATGTPHLRRTAAGAQLVFDGIPRLLLAGQAHNSSPSGEQYFTAVCEHVAKMNVQTLLVGISWSSTEPVEGADDFTILDTLLTQARAHQLRLVLLWFGSFKNAGSTYAPTWVRADTARFPRAVVHPTGRALFTYEEEMPKPVLSVFSPRLRQVEQRAFAALLQHLEREDPDHTVVMVQVENESGILRDSRDRSAAAQQAWEAEVPAALLGYLADHADRLCPELADLWSRQGRRTAGTWAEVFGEDWEAEEVFMAWGFASHAEALAATGKAQKPLPMYANSWLGPQPGQPRAGDYPSGGPASRVLDVWKAAAKSLDLLAPDIYVQDVKSAMADYARDDNPLFIPEAQFRTGSLFYALGHHRALVSACSVSRTVGWTASSPRPTRYWARCRTSSRRRRPRTASRASCSMKNPGRLCRSAATTSSPRAAGISSVRCCSTPVFPCRRRHRPPRARLRAQGSHPSLPTNVRSG